MGLFSNVWQYQDDKDDEDEENDKDDIRMGLLSNFWQSSVLDCATAADAAHGWDNFDIAPGIYNPTLDHDHFGQAM